MEDTPRVAEIHVFGWRSAYRGIIPDEFLFNKMIVADRVSTWQKRVSGNEIKDWETHVYDDGIIKGMLIMGPSRDDDKKSSFELGGIYVEPLMKRQGVGKSLVQFCENRAKELGFGEIILWVFEANTQTRKFYEAMGYMPDGAVKKHEWHKDATVVRYAKTIDNKC